MKLDQKLILALLSMLDEKVPVNKNSLCKRAGIHRPILDRRISKHNEFTDVEVIENER